MTKLKLDAIVDEKPVKLTLDIPAALHRDLLAYGEILGQQAGQPAPPPAKLIVPMLDRFLKTDRGFARARKQQP